MGMVSRLVALCVLASLVVGVSFVEVCGTSSSNTLPRESHRAIEETQGVRHNEPRDQATDWVRTATALPPVTSLRAVKPAPPPSPYPTLSLGAKSNGVIRLQELLSTLGYLPVTFKATQAVVDTSTNQISYISNPPQGGWTWTYKSTPLALKRFWELGVYNVLTQGAVMHYQAVSHLPVDGVAGPEVWSHLMKDDLAKHKNPDGYSYVYTSKSYPETLRLWKNGSIVLTSLVNTGVSGASTPSGTWPIFLRFASQTMSGHTPSGQYYSDPGVPWVNYFYGGCAIHGFYRSSYGYPQSLGCVEMPVYKSAIAWKLLTYGTLVTVGP